jgi:hypothetical protein
VHGVLGDVVIDLETSVGEEARERLAPLDRIAERLGQFGLRRQLDHGCVGPCEECIEQRPGLLAVFHPLGDRGELGLGLDDIDRCDPIERRLGDRRFRSLPDIEEFPATMALLWCSR